MTLTRILVAATLCGCAGSPAPRAAAVAPESKAAELERLYAEYWEEHLKLNPVAATFQGDPRYNDQLPDSLSAEHRAREREHEERWLARVEAVGDAGLEGQALLSYRIFVRKRKLALEADRYPTWLLPVNQFGSLPALAARLGSGTSAQPFKTVADYEAWLARGSRVPVLLDTAIANMREGVRAGVVQPRVLMEKVLPQLDALIKDRPEDTEFWGPIQRMPADFPAAERERLASAYRELVADRLMPSYRKLRAFIADEYLPRTRPTVGLDALPDGAAWYAFNVRRATTTDLTPAQIHEIGLAEVARIHGEIRKVMAEVGFKGDLGAFFRFMQEDPRFSFASEEALLAYYRGLEARVNARVPELFSLVPKAPFEIRPVEPFRARSAAGGSYVMASEDGNRPGIFYVNTYDLPTRKTWDAEDLFLHEAIPGHHFEIALRQEQKALPMFRRFGGETAFSEGWGLYAESLGKPLGLYTDPYSHFGYLQNELWRAIRLVVDTGLHSKGWTREQVIRYMRENSAEAETQSVAEAERYIAIPGQALAYKIGELKIKELRARAERELGPRFDIRAFHAEVLRDGSVPLDVLEEKIARWIREQTS
jgi:uncharacterized protein (DUF885 family)